MGNEKLQLGKVTTSKYGNPSINLLNVKILDYVTKIYSPFGFEYHGGDKDISVEGMNINSMYIGKMVNNYTVFKKIIEINKISSESSFYEYMEGHLYDIYNWKGKYFKQVTLPILINSSRKGNKGESKSFDFFKSELSKKNIIVNIESPTIEEDISGIDGKFLYNNRYITIQVKPYDRATVNSSNLVKVFSQGSLSLSTDYLILYREDSFIIVKAKDITIDGNYFKFDKDKVVAKI